MPRSREGIRAYFEQWRPKLAVSEDALDMVDFILHLEVALPPSLEPWKKAALMPAIRLFGLAVVSTYPAHIRAMFNRRQGKFIDTLVLPPTKLIHSMLNRSLNARFQMMGMLAPAAMDTAAPTVLGIPALEQTTMTPREAQAKYGYDIPSEAHSAMRARQHDRVFTDHAKPSDDGLLESEELIGQIFATA